MCTITLHGSHHLTEQDIQTGEKSKEEYYREAVQYLNRSTSMMGSDAESAATLSFLTRGVF